MNLQDLIAPLERLREEAFFHEKLQDLHYVFDDFVYHFKCYAYSRDENSFKLLTNDEITCITRFDEHSTFLSDSLLVVLDVMEAVKIDSLGDNAQQDEKERAEYLIQKSIEEIARITFEDLEKDDPDFDEHNN
jgi:hypothetical protein